MIDIKTPEQIRAMEEGGKILSDTLHAICAAVKPGMSELEIDQMAETMIRERGGEPGFMKVPGWRHTICVSTNDVVVHGIPTDYRLNEGDVIGIDCGVYYKGFHTDMSETLRVSKAESRMQNSEFEKVDNFLKIGKKALVEGIKQARGGNRVGHISQTIQRVVEGSGYSVVKSLIGHGVGRELHEEPEVPGYLDRSLAKTPLLRPGMTIAIEVIYNMGSSEVVYSRGDDWTISTQDGKISGVFERSVAITDGDPIILTP